MKKIISLILVLATLAAFALPFATSTAAATPPKTGYTEFMYATRTPIDTKGEDLYIVTKNAPVRIGQSVRSELYCYFNKNTVFVSSESTKTHYKITMDKKTVYINKEYCSKVGSTYNAYLALATKNCVIRSAPYESASSIVSLKKNDVIRIVSNNTIRNKYLIGDHWWTAVYIGKNKIGYVYTKNISTIPCLSLAVTGDKHNMMVGDTMKMSYSISPAVNNVVWSSSNSKVAKIDSSGKVTAISKGTCKISASIKNIITVTFELKIESWENYVKTIYSESKKIANKKTFNGYCGVFVGSQIKAAGITNKIVAENGNNQFDYYVNYANKHNSKTDNGYTINSYPATQYDLKTCLNKLTNNGKKAVDNILIGFHTGSGEDGRKWGHSTVIHHISADGKVFFTESFTAKVAGKVYPEGTPIVCTIDQFIQYYNSWCKFEGIIHFSK